MISVTVNFFFFKMEMNDFNKIHSATKKKKNILKFWLNKYFIIFHESMSKLNSFGTLPTYHMKKVK